MIVAANTLNELLLQKQKVKKTNGNKCWFVIVDPTKAWYPENISIQNIMISAICQSNPNA